MNTYLAAAIALLLSSALPAQREVFLTIADVRALEHNLGGADRSAPRVVGQSGSDPFRFEVFVDSKALPERVREVNPFDRRKRTILACAHGGFAYDSRAGRGEVYWFLQGAGILRVQRDRTVIELLATDPQMLQFNLHNATFFEHDGEPRIAWPADGGARVFITGVDGELLHTITAPTVAPYTEGARYSPTDTAYLDGLLWVTDGYGSQHVMSYDLDAGAWTGTVFGGKTDKPEPGKFGTNHGITIHGGLLWISGRFFARIHSYQPDTTFEGMFPLPDGSKPCDFEFFVSDGALYGVAASLDHATGSEDRGASIYIVDMKTLEIVSTVRPLDELGLEGFVHLHNVFPTVDDGVVTLFCQAWNGGDFAVLRQVMRDSEKPEQAETPEQADRVDKADKADKADKVEKLEPPGKPEKSDR